MKRIFLIIGLALLAIFLLATPAEAQIGNGRLYSFDLDTLTNADTITLDFPWALNDDYDFTIEVTATNISGTTAFTATLQESLSGAGYADTDTLTFTASGTQFSTGVNTGRYHRVYLLSSGTHATSVKVWMWYRKKK
jgi:hypothetical protein